MVCRGRIDGREAVISHKHTSVSLAIGDGWVAAWDLGGRLFSVWREGHTFGRGLSGAVLHKWRDTSDRHNVRGRSDVVLCRFCHTELSGENSAPTPVAVTIDSPPYPLY